MRLRIVASGGAAIAAVAVGAGVVVLGPDTRSRPHHEESLQGAGPALRAALTASYARVRGAAGFVPAAHASLEPVTAVSDGRTWRFAVYRNRLGWPC